MATSILWIETKFVASPVTELSRLYKFVSKLVEYRDSLKTLPEAERRLAAKQKEVEEQQSLAKSADKAVSKKANDLARRFAATSRRVCGRSRFSQDRRLQPCN